MKKIAPILLLAYIVVAVAALSSGKAPEATATFETSTGESIEADLLVADTRSERKRGLMYRKEVPLDGMVFVYGSEQERSFWMKNTLIPLDMVFVGSNGTINQIHTAYPEPNTSDDELTRYEGNARYVIELEANYTRSNGVKEGDSVDLEILKN